MPSLMAARWVDVLPPNECYWVVNASPLNYGWWVGQNSGRIFSCLWTKVDQIKFTYAGVSVVCNAIFRLTMSCCVLEIFAMKSRSYPKSRRNFMFLGRQISGGRGPQISDRILYVLVKIEHEHVTKQAFIQKFSPGGVNLTQGSHTGEARRAEARRAEARGPKGQEWGVGFLGRLGSLESAVSSPAGSGAQPQKILIFCISGTQKCQTMHFPCIHTKQQHTSGP